jgi:hypothetical protein
MLRKRAESSLQQSPAPPTSLRTGDMPATRHEPDQNERAYNLLLYGNEQMIQGSDNVTLVAFAALAYQQIRGKGEPHHNLGCGFLLLSVLMCAIVHFSLGNAYVSQARKMIRGGDETAMKKIRRRFFLTLALIAAVAQFTAVILGVCLVLLPDTPPGWVARVFKPFLN